MAGIKLWKYYEDGRNNMQKQIHTTFPNLFYCSTKEPSESISIVSSQQFTDRVARDCHSGLLKLQPVLFYNKANYVKQNLNMLEPVSHQCVFLHFFFFSYSVVRRTSGKPGHNLMKETDDDQCETLEAQLR